MSGYEWYPLAVQLWIWGVAAVSVVVVALLLWLLWGRPLRAARIVIEETDGYRALTLMESKQKIDRIIDRAEAEILNNVVGLQLADWDADGQQIVDRRHDLGRYGEYLKRTVIEVDDVT